MYCPTCKNRTLRPTKLAYGLPSFSCKSCGGSLLEILGYRMWCDKNSAGQDKKKISVEANTSDSRQTLVCPKCSNIMTKFQIARDTENKIDLCNNCGRFWLDGGEWNLLEQINLENEITNIFNEPWQSAIRKDQSNDAFEEKYQKIVGAADYRKMKDFRDWLASHPNRDEIINYINHDFG